MTTSVPRTRSMCLVLSDEEMNALDTMAKQLGMPKVSLIRQWIRDASKSAPMPSHEALIRELRKAFGSKIRRG